MAKTTFALAPNSTATALAWADDELGGRDDLIIAGWFTGALRMGPTQLRAAEASPTTTANPPSAAPASDAFIARIGRAGTARWALSLGGPGPDRASALAARAGRIALGLEVTPPADLGTGPITGHGQPDAAVVALTSTGDAARVAWTQPLYSSRYARVTALALAEDGAVTAVGWFAGTLRVGDQILTSAGATDLFALRLSPDGNPQWARRLGGPGTDLAHAVSVTGPAVAIAGEFTTAVDIGQRSPVPPGGFIAHVGPDGTIEWIHSFGPGTAATAVTTDRQGALYVAGQFQGELPFGQHTLASLGQTDMFAARLEPTRAKSARPEAARPEPAGTEPAGTEPSGTGPTQPQAHTEAAGPEPAGSESAQPESAQPALTPTWVTRIAGTELDSARALAVTDAGVMLTGSFAGTASAQTQRLDSAGDSDIAIVRLDPADGAVIRAERIGGPGYDQLSAAALGPGRRLAVTGRFEQRIDLASQSLTTTSPDAAFVAVFGF